MRQIRLMVLLGALLALTGVAAAQDVTRPEGWDDESHGNDVDPNYAVVFPQDKVNEITITISPEHWQAMLDDMTNLYGEFGSNPGGGGPMMNEDIMVPPGGAQGMPPEGMQPPPDGQGGPRIVRGGGMDFSMENPIWVEADVEMDGVVWTNAGIRFKGNSSLASAWRSGNYKLPFKLNMDEFEDAHPEIDNQRFYGFDELSFSSNWSDDSLLREKVTADIFREAGLASANTAFYAVYVDYGEGPVYFGLYTAVEVVEDTVIGTQFADDSGNAYKPEGAAATFAAGSFNEEELDKQNNEDEADYSDVQALYEALHSETRTTDPEAWQDALEAVFDVDTFLKWMAANTVVQNWDTYGQMSHNYYLYNDPETGLLTWIPWDNNMALGDGAGMGGMFRIERRGGPPADQTTQPGDADGGQAQSPVMRGGPGGPGGDRRAMELDKSGVSDEWPLISYLWDVPEYQETYRQYVAEVAAGAFEPTKMAETYQYYHDLIAPYVTGENGEQAGHTHLSSPDAFDTALQTLIDHAQARYDEAMAYVEGAAVEE
jgi:spore coat protein H